MNTLRRLQAKWRLFVKTRRMSRLTRWLGCDARMGVRMLRLTQKDEVFAWKWYVRNCRRMQRLSDNWGYFKTE